MKKGNWLLILIIAVALLFSTATPTWAAKKRVWSKATTTSAGSGKFSVSAKLTGWKQYLNVTFKGLANTKGVNYELIYSSNGVDQGAGGRVEASGNSVSKSIFMGTCSYLVCTAHKNISNLRFTVTYQTTSGQSVTKNYKVKY